MTRDELYKKMFDYFYQKIRMTLKDGKSVVGTLRNIEKRGDNDDVEGYEDIALYDIILPDGEVGTYDETEVVNVEPVQE